MKQALRSLTFVFLFVTLISPSSSFAGFCQSNGVGDWDNPNTWLRDGAPGVPQPGDIVIITGADLIFLRNTVDLQSLFDDSPTLIVIYGNLVFLSPSGDCSNNECDIDLLLDTDSEILVEVENGIQEGGPGLEQKQIFIGGVSALGVDEWPFGPGILPQLIQLPLELLSFNGKESETTNILEWNTNLEENVLEFVIERAENEQQDFQPIGTVSAVGNTQSIHSYFFEDRQPLATAYYRLKMVDIDQSFTYSDIIVVERAQQKPQDIKVYPVPIGEVVNIEFYHDLNTDATLSINNILGQAIYSIPIELNEGLNKLVLPIEVPVNGVHFIQIQTQQQRFVKKIQ